MDQRKHAILFAWPGQGHLNPLWRFSELLLSQGFFVTFVHNEHNLQKVERLKKKKSKQLSPPTPPPPTSDRFRLVGIPDGLPPDHPRDVLSLIHATDGLTQPLITSFEALVGRLVAGKSSAPQVQEEEKGGKAEIREEELLFPPPTLIASDFFMTFTQDVANKFNLPRVAVYVQSATSFACHVAVSQGFKPSPGDQVIDSIEGVPPTLKPTEMISFLQCYDPTDTLFNYMLRSFTRLSEPTWILLNTFGELEHGAVQALQEKHRNILCAGPLLPSMTTTAMSASESLWDEEHDCMCWLEKQASSSVLFVSFGSLATLPGDQAAELALGLESSGRPFLWVVREGLVEGDGRLPAGFQERVSDRACFVPWAPQWKVLAHPSIGGFLTHCGWNSVLESIACGVPMLGFPYFADQMLNCRCIEDEWQVGFGLSSSEAAGGGLVSRHQVAEKVRALLLELPPSVKAKCQSLKEAALRAITTRQDRTLAPIFATLSNRP